MARLLLLPALGVVVTLLAGCTWFGQVDLGAPRTSPDDERTVEIYAAVVEELVTEDHTYGEADPGFTTIYVLDGAVRGTGWFRRLRSRPRVSFSDDLKSELAAALADLPPLIFVRTRSEAYGGREPETVKKGGVLLTLGPISGGERRAEVGTELWMSGQGAQWLTYVVRLRNGEWRIAGTTGPVAIS